MRISTGGDLRTGACSSFRNDAINAMFSLPPGDRTATLPVPATRGMGSGLASLSRSKGGVCARRSTLGGGLGGAGLLLAGGVAA